MAINPDTVRGDIFKEFFAVAVASMTTISSGTVSAAFVSDITRMPQLVVHKPIVVYQPESFGTSSVAYNQDGSILIEAYATSLRECIEISDLFMKTYRNNPSLLSVSNVTLNEGGEDNIELSGRYIHVLSLPISFKYRG